MTSSSRLSILVCVIMCMSCVSANSSGLGLPCNVDNPYLGATPRIMVPDLQHSSGRNMTWSLKPVFAGNMYTVRSGDGAPGSDPTSYVPDQYTTITIRANVQDQQFTGLLMYAVNSAGTRVGSWLIAPRQSFQVDPATGCVTHSNAEIKNYKSVFRVKFPRGTGPVTIKALVKYGLAFPEARGAFYWPNSQHLTLTEGTPVTQQWFQGAVGESCNVVCAKQNLGCDLATLQSAGTQASLITAVSKTTGCFGPMMKGCGSASPTFGTEGCFYQDPTCTRDPVQFDPCAGIPAWSSSTIYNPSATNPQCVTYSNPNLLGGLTYKWCAQFYNQNNAPSGGQNQGGNPWWVFNQCAPAGGYPQAGGPARAAVPSDCSSVKTTTDDGYRLCACSNGMPVSTSTDPPLPNTPAPTAPPMNTGGATNAPATTSAPTPTLPTCTNPPVTQAPATTKPATTSAPTSKATTAPTAAPLTDGVTLIGGPASIPTSGTFQIMYQYSAAGARSLVADILLPSSNYAYFGGGYVNVAANTQGYVTLTLTVQNNPAPGMGYIINVWMVDQAIYMNGQNPQAWTKSIGGQTPFSTSVMSGAVVPQPTMPPTNPPTATPTLAPTDPNTAVQPTSAPTDAPTSAPTDATQPTPDPDCQPAPAGTTTAPTPTKNLNSASTPSPHILLSVLSLGLAGVMSRSSSMLVLVSAMLMLCTVPGISAHNWLSSPARGNMGGLGQFNGNTVPPCPPKTTRTHVQVAAGQRFPVEWASGHGFGSFTYLTLIKASDESSLGIISTSSGSGNGGSAALDEYLAGGVNNYMPDEKAIHINPTGASGSGDTSLNFASAAATTALLKPLRATNVFRQDNVNAAMTFYNKTTIATANDLRVQYFNPKYPFIISAHKFALHEDRPDAMDWTMMEIPKGFPAGQYVIQYQWRGYFDCVDINVLDKPVVTDVWGKLNGDPNGKKSYDKYHHTLYTPYLTNYAVGKCTEIPEGSDISACAQLCEQNQIAIGGGTNVPCDSLTVAPAQLNTALVKFPGLFKSNTSHLPPACDTVVASLKAPAATAQVCFTQKSGIAPLVGPAFKSVFDPEDPTFYMTTYIQKAPWIFADVCSVCVPPPSPSDFRFSDQCISCVDMQRNFFTTLPPRWTIQNTCQHCDNRLG